MVPAPLIERDEELSRLCAALDASADGAGGLVVLEGAAGIGKTRLLQAARERAAERGMEVVTARGAEIERGFSYGVVRQLFERPVAAAGAAALSGAAALAAPALSVAPEAEPVDFGLTVAHGLYWLTVDLAERRPLLLAVDDAHWGDEPSLRFLVYLARRLEGTPVCLVVTTRPEREALALTELARQPLATALHPQPLSERAVAALIATAYGREPDGAFAAACASATGGNPFLLCELVRALRADGVEPLAEASAAVHSLGPRTVARSVLLRLGNLPPAVTGLARSVAVLGGECELRHGAELAGVAPHDAPAAAHALEAAEILGPGRPLRFIHPILREAIYADMPAAEREAAHARAAAILEAAGRSPEVVAPHVAAGAAYGSPHAVELLRRAAATALSRGVPAVAVGYLARALAEPPRDADRAGLLVELSAAELRTGRLVEAEEHAQESLAGCPRGRVAAEGRRELARAVLARGDVRRYVAQMEAAAADTDADDHQLALGIEADMAGIAWQEPDVADRVVAALERHADLPGDTPAELAVLAVLSRARTARGHTAADAVAVARRAQAGGRLLAASAPESPPLLTSVYVLILADAFGEAERQLDAQLTRARDLGSTIGLTGGWLVRSLLRLRQGGLREAEADARSAMSALQAAQLHHIAAPASLAVVVESLVLRGLVDDAEAELGDSGLGEELPGSASFARLQHSRALLRLAQGRNEEALADLRRAGARDEPAGMLNFAAPWRAHAALALHALGRGEEAAALAEEWLVLAERWGAPSSLAPALRVAARTGDRAQRLERLERAAALLDGSGARLEHAETLCDLGAELRRTGRRGPAQNALRAADELARASGAEPLVVRAREELRVAGARPLARRFSGMEALTASERRVAELAAADQSNKDIAQALFVTAKTVENHLGRVYHKLGIHSRRHLADALREDRA